MLTEDFLSKNKITIRYFVVKHQQHLRGIITNIQLMNAQTTHRRSTPLRTLPPTTPPRHLDNSKEQSEHYKNLDLLETE